MAQMPEEGRKFGIVDSYWKDIMSETSKVGVVLVWVIVTVQFNPYYQISDK